MSQAKAQLAEYIAGSIANNQGLAADWLPYLQGQTPAVYVAEEAECTYTPERAEGLRCEMEMAVIEEQIRDWRCFTCTVNTPWSFSVSAGAYSVNQAQAFSQLIAQLVALGFDTADWPPQWTVGSAEEWVTANATCAYTPVNVSGRVCQLNATAAQIRIR